jgi:hypothetical protein
VFINCEFQELLGAAFRRSLLDNVANDQIRAANLNWGTAFNVRTSNAIGMHRCDVGCDGTAIGWL